METVDKTQNRYNVLHKIDENNFLEDGKTRGKTSNCNCSMTGCNGTLVQAIMGRFHVHFVPLYIFWANCILQLYFKRAI